MKILGEEPNKDLLMDFTFDNEDGDKPIVSRLQLMDKNSCKVFYDKLTCIFVQVSQQILH